jgi:hypothetical protein
MALVTRALQGLSVFVFSHFFPSLFNNTSHTITPQFWFLKSGYCFWKLFLVISVRLSVLLI